MCGLKFLQDTYKSKETTLTDKICRAYDSTAMVINIPPVGCHYNQIGYN